MTDHPYAGSQTLTPGETADDDPFDEGLYCPDCDEEVEPLNDLNTCPLCGGDLEQME